MQLTWHRSFTLWLALLLLSLLVHIWLSWRASVVTATVAVTPPAPERTVDIQLVSKPPLKELVFEDKIEFEPPEVLVPTAAVTPPPPDVDLAIKAAAGGASRGASLPLLTDMAVTAGRGAAGFGTGVGNGLSNSTQGFAAYVQGLRETGLDVVFVVDTTGSMDWVLNEARAHMIDIVDAVRLLVPVSRFGVVAYRDYDSPGYVTHLQPLTFSLNKLTRFLGVLTAEGGGDLPEAVAAGLEVGVAKAGWRLRARKVIILIGDAPPHEGELRHALSLARQFATDGGQLSALDVSDDANPALIEAVVGRPVDHNRFRNKPMYDFQQLAEAGGGIATTMAGDVRITKQLMSLILGGRFASEAGLLLEGFVQ
ncbi:MAG: vWA domain-containing protein [Porticoccaceae bacterium]